MKYYVCYNGSFMFIKVKILNTLLLQLLLVLVPISTTNCYNHHHHHYYYEITATTTTSTTTTTAAATTTTTATSRPSCIALYISHNFTISPLDILSNHSVMTGYYTDRLAHTTACHGSKLWLAVCLSLLSL